ncbi:MAG TPA: tetratricopeptide repeat protein, partial [Geobacteraceae bacterium]
FIAAVWGAAELARGREKALAVVAGGVLLVLSVLTWHQLGYWRDSITLFSHAVAVTDRNFLAHNNLATAFYNDERFTEAIEHYTLALEGEHPLKAQILQNLANARAARREKGEVYFRRGLALAAAGDERTAVELFRQALAIDADNPFAHYNLAVALERQGALDEALRHYGEALRLRPGYREAQENLEACRRRLAAGR